MPTCEYVYESRCVQRSKASSSLELQAIVSHLMQVLGTEPGPSGKAAIALNP